MKIYVPDLNSYACYYVYSSDVIRAYEEIPQNNKTINYRDYYINSNYIYKDGYTNFSSYATLPICLDSSNLTSNYYYRNDFDKILIIFAIFVIFCFYFPWRIFRRILWRR